MATTVQIVTDGHHCWSPIGEVINSVESSQPGMQQNVRMQRKSMSINRAKEKLCSKQPPSNFISFSGSMPPNPPSTASRLYRSHSELDRTKNHSDGPVDELRNYMPMIF